MTRFKGKIVLLAWSSVAAIGCVDVVHTEAPEPWVTESPAVAPDSDVPAEAEAEGDYIRPELKWSATAPEAVGCSERSIIGEVDLTNPRVGEPIVEERFGRDGCVQERWVRDWDGAALLSEHYDFFDPDMARYVYVEPFSYTDRREYDAEGREISRTRAVGESSEPFFVETVRRDEAGNIVERVRRNHEMHPTTTIEVETHDVWTYRSDGELLEHRHHYDGALSSTERRVYDEEGNLLERWRGDGDGEHLVASQRYDDGLLVSVQTFDEATGWLATNTEIERRADGTKVRSVTRHHRNGWLDVHVFDEAEREVEYTQDSDLDGQVDYRKTQTFDEQGQMTSQSVAYDFDASGIPRSSSEKRWEFDDRGRMLREWDSPAWRDGITSRTTYTYDESGHTVVVELLGTEGNVDRRHQISRWADEDRMLWQRTDHDRDGVLEAHVVNRWNGHQPLETLSDFDGDGQPDSVRQWIYDAADQLAEHRVDEDADGMVDYRELFLR